MSATRRRRRIRLTHTLAVCAFLLLAAVACSHASPLSPDPGKPLSADLEVRWTPVPVPAEDRWHIVYELHVRNLSEPGLALSSAEVIVQDSDSPPLYSWSADTSTEATRHIEVLADGGAETLVLYIWLALDRNEVPRALSHRVTLISADGRRAMVEGAPVAVDPALPLVLGPPLRGANWVATNGPGNDSGHRRAIYDSGDGGLVPQRFATDWVRADPGRPVDRDSETFAGDPLVNANHFAYLQEVVAVADGTVTTVVDGVPDNAPNNVPDRLFGDTVAGNYIVVSIDGADGAFAVYAHLSPRSMRVGEGDVVRQGEVIALVGNSGFSSKPHLHFHVTDGDAPLQAEGLPYVIDQFGRLGRLGRDGRAGFHRAFDVPTFELPLSGMVVSFEGDRSASPPGGDQLISPLR